MTQLKVDFKFTPREWQDKCIKEQGRYTVVAVHRRGGKTTLAIAILILSALKKENALFTYIAPELKQAKIIAWDELKRQVQQFQSIQNGRNKVSLVQIYESELSVRFWNGATIRLFGADKPDRLRGAKLAGAVLDEVAQMAGEMWTEIVRPALMDSKGWGLFIGTPKGINLFSELFDNERKGLAGWKSLKFTCYETNAIDPEELEAYKAEVGEDSETFKREMLCDFSASSEDQLISLGAAQNAVEKQVEPAYQVNTELVLGVDVARYGKDNSVLFFRKGLIAEEPIIFKNMDFFTLARHIKDICDERMPKAVFVDGTGMGCGVPDILKGFGLFNVYDVNFTASSTDLQYTNLRTQLWFRLKEWLQKGGSIPNNQQLVEELSMPQYRTTEDAKYALETKDNIRKRLHGRSPDYADALALTFYINFDYQRMPSHYGMVDVRENKVANYDPFTAFRNERQGTRSRTRFCL